MSAIKTILQRVRQTLTRQPESVPAPQWLVVGLGNPGAKYQDTRHNVGYMAVDKLISQCAPQAKWRTIGPAHIIPTQIADTDVLLVRSTTYMNESGIAIAALSNKFGVPAERIIVLHDELDLPEGTVRIKSGGNENGHNGLKSTTAELGTRDYLRIRMGIGRPPAGTPVVEYVLAPIDATTQLRTMIERTAQGVHSVIERGLMGAQNEIHALR